MPITTAVNTDQLDSAPMFRDMFPRPPSDSNKFYAMIDNLMYYLLLFLKNIIQDDTACLINEFVDTTDNAAGRYLYNNQTLNNLRLLNPFNCFEHAVLCGNGYLNLTIAGTSALTFAGNWCQIFVLSPSLTHVLSNADLLRLQLYITGHNHMFCLVI